MRMATRGRGDWNFGSAQEYTAGGLRRGSEVGTTGAEEEEDRQEEEEDRQEEEVVRWEDEQGQEADTASQASQVANDPVPPTMGTSPPPSPPAAASARGPAFVMCEIVAASKAAAPAGIDEKNTGPSAKTGQRAWGVTVLKSSYSVLFCCRISLADAFIWAAVYFKCFAEKGKLNEHCGKACVFIDHLLSDGDGNAWLHGGQTMKPISRTWYREQIPNLVASMLQEQAADSTAEGGGHGAADGSVDKGGLDDYMKRLLHILSSLLDDEAWLQSADQKAAAVQRKDLAKKLADITTRSSRDVVPAPLGSRQAGLDQSIGATQNDLAQTSATQDDPKPKVESAVH